MNGVLYILRGIWHWLVYLKVLTIAPIGFSLMALYFSLHDRRPKLVVRVRKGQKLQLKRTGEGNMFRVLETTLEVYNLSHRPNAIRDYDFSCNRLDERYWRPMENHFQEFHLAHVNTEGGNITPLSIGPYGAACTKIIAVFLWAADVLPPELVVKIVVEDLFGKKYSLNLTAIT